MSPRRRRAAVDVSTLRPLVPGILAEARRVVSLENRLKALRAQVREAEAELKQARKNLTALAASGPRDPFDQSPPIKGLDS